MSPAGEDGRGTRARVSAHFFVPLSTSIPHILREQQVCAPFIRSFSAFVG